MSVSTGETGGAPETEPESDSGSESPPRGEHRALYYLRVAVYVLGLVLGLSLLTVGTVALIAEMKGTWHWMIHLESTISYMSIFVVAVVAALVPLSVAMLVGRWWVND